MAVVTSSFNLDAGNMVLQTVPYVGAGGMDLVNTPVPRAELNFQIELGAVTLSGVGDTQAVNIKCVLPLSFAYLVQEISITGFFGTDANDWDDWGICRIKSINTEPTQTWQHSFDLWSRGAFGVGLDGKNYHLNTSPDLNRLAIPGVSADLTVILANTASNKSAMTINFLARFLQYDINQAFSLGPNVPVPVR